MNRTIPHKQTTGIQSRRFVLGRVPQGRPRVKGNGQLELIYPSHNGYLKNVCGFQQTALDQSRSWDSTLDELVGLGCASSHQSLPRYDPERRHLRKHVRPCDQVTGLAILRRLGHSPYQPESLAASITGNTFSRKTEVPPASQAAYSAAEKIYLAFGKVGVQRPSTKRVFQPQ